jgi:hypothetical protein
MAGVRSAKLGKDWTADDLASYNIVVRSQTKRDFFGTAVLPNPTGPLLQAFLTTQSRTDAVEMHASPGTRQLLHYLELAMVPRFGHQTAVANFATELLKALGYDAHWGIAFIGRNLPLFICGSTSVAETDVCIMDDGEVFLLLQEDKRRTVANSKDPEPQIIAAAIAAYSANNITRETMLYLPRKESIMFPAITLDRTNPTFYKITVSSGLSEAVQAGLYPEIQTVVHRYIPTLPNRTAEGQAMQSLANRREILECLEGFKAFLNSW